MTFDEWVRTHAPIQNESPNAYARRAFNAGTKAALESRVSEQDRIDAERFRWLVKNCFDWAAPGDGDSFDHIELHFESDMLSRDDESVGRAIDAEISKEASK